MSEAWACVEHDSPLGVLLLVKRDGALTHLSFENEHEMLRATLEDTLGSPTSPTPELFDRERRQLDEYFAGSRETFTLTTHQTEHPNFRQRVQHALRQIPFGTTVSYGTLASLVQSPRAARAVGTACATNPLPIVQPCHRVLAADGSLGGYSGGLWRKELLLALER